MGASPPWICPFQMLRPPNTGRVSGRFLRFTIPILRKSNTRFSHIITVVKFFFDKAQWSPRKWSVLCRFFLTVLWIFWYNQNWRFFDSDVFPNTLNRRFSGSEIKKKKITMSNNRDRIFICEMMAWTARCKHYHLTRLL
jgi:hypothetical protein